MLTKKLFKLKQPRIGKLIRELRFESGLTQEQFAAELGVVFPTVNRWENGHAQPSPLALKGIEIILNQLGERGQILLNKHLIEE